MKNYFFALLFLVTLPIYAQDTLSLNTYTFAEAEKLQQKEARPYAVFIYTDWCRYCHGMKKNTFNDTPIIQTLNTSYYFILLNAEEKNDILFTEHTFTYTPSGTKTGVHELAAALGKIEGQLSFPTTVLLNPRNEIIFQYAGFIDNKELIAILMNGLK